ncbi:MAG TPA: SpoIIE family protein phosphatase [Terracidiphilus sp.]|nr:SpoIIE family protein phosphatase [Terracidiphilus sp.]
MPASTLQSPAPALSGLHPVATLDGPWRFQIGDDPSFASPTFDDSNWITVYLSKPLSEQGIGSYSGFAWYRLRLQPEQLSALGLGTQNDPSELLVTGNSVGQLGLFINGLETGRTEGMGDKLASYQSPPFVSSLSAPAADGSRVLAVRTWAPAGVPVRRGILARVDLGPASAIATLREAALARAWTGNALSSIAVAFLFFCVAILGAALYFAQRGHSEYLWLTLLCLVVACNSVIDTLFDLSHLPLESTQLILRFGGHLFIIVTLEFVLRFTGSSWRRTVRGAQLLAVVLPFTGFFLPFLVYRVLAVSAQAFFCTLACIILFRAWRMGQRDAGVMLIPFFLASMADSADTVLNYFASIHWLPAAFASRAYHFGPIDFGIDTLSYLVFLFSIVAVILFRFIRVSQDEQRSAAEISAARSVQALLIPTQLPRSRHFVLESAYLPINGVGGDFFQVFPLQDDSLLLVVGDVSGKGLQAAMNSSTLVGALRNELSYDPATILAHLNRVLIGAVASPGAVPEIDAAPGFATCLCARIYPDGSMTIANAGHLSPYRDGREMEIEPNLPLGVIAGVEYSQTTHTFSQGQRIVFVSDGVVEAANAQGELFGFDRTRQVSVESARYIAQTAKHFGQTDDITVVSLYIAATDASPGTSTARHSQIGAVESA